MAQAERAPVCLSRYREGGWKWTCEKPGGHEGKHSGWSTGRSRDWTDDEAEGRGGDGGS